MTLKVARVRVPCSTSNLGSGYDTVGLALRRHVVATFEPGGRDGLVVRRGGTLARLDREGEPDLVAEFLARGLGEAGEASDGELRLESQIPVARGLGASAAAIVAGCELARAALGLPPDPEASFRAALAREGHGDNAAPSAFGGLRAVVKTPEGPRVMELPLAPSIGFAYAAPAAGVSTQEARGILPRQVPHEVAARSLGRLAALLRGLATGDPELIGLGMKDDLHVPYRLPMIPGAMAAMSAAVDAGAWAVTVSGAGSGLIALCDPEGAADIAETMRAVFDAGVGDPECVGFAVEPSPEGVERLDS